MTKKNEKEKSIQAESERGEQNVGSDIVADGKVESDVKECDLERDNVELTAHQICNVLRVNQNTRAYIEHKYKDQEMKEDEWKTNLKKDGLSF